MIQPVLVWARGRQEQLGGFPLPLALAELVAGTGPWEVELGFGKGRYLLDRAHGEPQRRFLGVEMASKYYRLAARRAERRGLSNLALLRGEALYLLAAALPRRFADAVHVYFPDPWPKSRHHKRRLFDPETVDLVLGLLAAGGRLLFATDFLDYGQRVMEILEGYPGLAVERLGGAWPGGPRTNYEAKYVAEGRPILRLEARLEAALDASLDRVPLHPEGRLTVTGY